MDQNIHVQDQPSHSESIHCDNVQSQVGTSQLERNKLQQGNSDSHSGLQVQQLETHSVRSNMIVEGSQSSVDHGQSIPQSSDNQQQQMQHLENQSTAAANQATNSMKMAKPTPTIPFHMLIPILRPHLDKDRNMQLHSIFNKLRSNEVNKEEFLRVIRNIVGDQKLRQAAQQVHMQMQDQAPDSSQTGVLQGHSSGSRQFSETQPVVRPNSMTSNVVTHPAQIRPANIASNPQMVPGQQTNKQQQQSPHPQTSPMYGSNNLQGVTFPRVVGTSTLRPQTSDSLVKQTHSTTVPRPSLQQTWHMSANKDIKASPVPPSTFVKQEIGDQTAETMSRMQVMNPESSFSSLHAKQMNSANTRGSIPQTTQVDSIFQASTTFSPHSGTTSKTPPKKPSVGQKKPLEPLGASPPPPSKKQKTSPAVHDQSIEQLNDVTAVSGVDLREEEAQLLAAPKEDNRVSEATRRIVQEEEESLILQRGPLHKKLTEIMMKCKLKSVAGDVERSLSMCVEERLRSLIASLIRHSKQRTDMVKPGHLFIKTADVHSEILELNQKVKEEWDKKKAEEAEKLRKQNETDGDTGADPEDKDDGRSKSLKANKDDDHKMDATAANVVARAALGGNDFMSRWQLMAEQRQKLEGVSGSTSSLTGRAQSNKTPRPGSNSKENQGEKGEPSKSAGGLKRPGRPGELLKKPARTISMKDMISVLEREPQMSKSLLLYRLYERSRSPAT